MNILTLAPAFMSGTAFLAIVYHLMIYSRLKQLRFNLTFAILSYTVVVYDFFTAGAYFSSSIVEGMWWSRAQTMVIHFCGIALLWFITDYIHHRPRKLLYGFSVTLLVSGVLSAINPFNILQNPSVPNIKHFDFGNGLYITYYEVESGVLASIQGLLIILVFSYIMVIIYQYYQKGYNKQAKPLFVVMIFLFIGIFNDAAVVIGLIQNIYLIEYVYTSVILYSTYVISKKVVDSVVLEQALRESDARYRHIVEGMSDGLALLDNTGKISYVNESLCKMTEYQSQELLGHRLSEFFDTENLARLENESGLLKKGKRGTTEIEWKGPAGSKIHVLISTAFLFEKSGRLKEGIVVVTDITERKRAEEALKKLYEETLRISEIKSALITFVSHELQTPLVPILGWSDLMQKALNKGLDLNQVVEKEGVESIIRSVNRLFCIINNFLDLDRLQRGTFALKKEQWLVTTLLTNALKEVTEIAQKKNITIKNTCENVAIHVDGFRIEQVFINILSNAIKYSPANTLVEIYSERSESTYSLLFRDQGYGFSPEELRDVWQPFSPVFLRKNDTKIPSTGIGLRLTKGIIEEHGCRIEISSPGLDQGSTVKIGFPLEEQGILYENPT
ncbi:MAG: sensor histidine kinase protein [Promethearchaeota archaeon CR_4]|nr:MAG: sensor histidine kinase protein [Candidatus Lokiarchaeota archaeon CR_4]